MAKPRDIEVEVLTRITPQLKAVQKIASGLAETLNNIARLIDDLDKALARAEEASCES